jgi:uncharacterized protein YkwD
MTLPSRLSRRLALLGALAIALPVSALEPSWPNMEEAERFVFEDTNAFRGEHGQRELAVDKTLAATAQRFADYMARTGKYAHDADGRTPGQRLRAAGYDYCMVAENIAFAFDSRGFRTQQLTDKFVEGWKASPGHRRNMLDADATVMGVAIAQSPSTGYYYAVQMFARPTRYNRCPAAPRK